MNAGWIDLTAGGVVGAGESPTENVSRELFEEYGIPQQHEATYYNVLKHESEHHRAYEYFYYLKYDGIIKPQESEIEAIFKWTPA